MRVDDGFAGSADISAISGYLISKQIKILADAALRGCHRTDQVGAVLLALNIGRAQDHLKGAVIQDDASCGMAVNLIQAGNALDKNGECHASASQCHQPTRYCGEFPKPGKLIHQD